MANSDSSSEELTFAPEPNPHSRVGLWVILFGLAIIQGLVINLMPIMLPTLGQELGIDKFHQGFVISAFFFGSTLALLIAGYLVNYLGAKFMAVLGMAVVGIAELLFGVAQSYEVVLVAAALMAVGIAPFPPVYAAIITAKFLDIRQRMYMLVYGVFAGAASIATASLGFLIEKHDFRQVFIVFGLFIGVWALLLFALFGRYLKAEVGRVRLSTRDKEAGKVGIREKLQVLGKFLTTGILTRGVLYLVGFIVIMDNLANGNFMVWIPTVFKEEYNISNVGMVLTVGTAGVFTFRMIMGALPSGWISDRILLGIFYGISMATFVAFLVLRPASPLIGYALVFVSFGFTGVQAPACYSIITAKFGKRAPAAIALVDVIGNSGFIFGPPLVGWIAQQVGQWQAMWFVPATGFTLVIVVLLWEFYDRLRGTKIEAGLVSEEEPFG